MYIMTESQAALHKSKDGDFKGSPIIFWSLNIIKTFLKKNKKKFVSHKLRILFIN
jgi:hypothetical protein